MIDANQGGRSPLSTSGDGRPIFPPKRKKKKWKPPPKRRVLTLFGLPKRVPNHLFHTFCDSERMLKVVHDLAVLQTELKKLRDHPASSLLDHEKIDYCFGVIRRELVSNTPFQICRACLTEENECPHCRGRRWVPAATREPENITERMNRYPLGFS